MPAAPGQDPMHTYAEEILDLDEELDRQKVLREVYGRLEAVPASAPGARPADDYGRESAGGR